MKRLIDTWMIGVEGLIQGVSVSFYTFFTIVFAEIIYSWFFLREKALLLTFVLIGYLLAICAFGYFKKIWTGTRKELILARLFLVMVAIVFAAGCFVDWLINIIFFVIPVGVAAVMVLIRDLQTMRFVASENKMVRFLCYVFDSSLIWLVAEVFVMAVPIACLWYVLSLIGLDSSVIVFIMAAYACIIPLIAWLEEEFVSDNIFELAYDVLWTEEFEKEISELERLLNSQPEKKEEKLEERKDCIEKIVKQD